MRTFIVCHLLLICFAVSAQRNCSTTQYAEQEILRDPGLVARFNQIESLIQQRSMTSAHSALSDGVIRIPVVVHILYHTQSQNITDAQVNSQLEVLNRDFRKLNTDSVNIPERFRGLAGDAQFEFILATADPAGRATTGIIRKQTTITEWRVDDKIKFTAQGGNDAWDSRYYLNIWVGNLRTTLGYATSPGSDPSKDGVVINATAFGTINTQPPFHLGRTAVHEIGHWFGLKHIWGDTYCGDDLVGDTPKQGGFTTGCPTTFRSSCNNAEMGDMYMNFMDYTNDACINLFTAGQVTRMRSMFNDGAPRNLLMQSSGLSQPWIVDASPVEKPHAGSTAFTVFPNPALNEITVINEASYIGKKMSVVNPQGIEMFSITINNIRQKVTVSGLSAGLYFVVLQNGDRSLRAKFIKL